MSTMAGRKKTVAIVQSNYLPWRGYFDLIRRSDEFILLDTVQYTRRDWRNRNIIKTPAGLHWITVPVEVKGKYHAAIDQIRIADPGFAIKHVRAIETNYRSAGAFEQVAPWLFSLLLEASEMPVLSWLNERLLVGVAHKLAITTPIRRCNDLLEREVMERLEPTARLVALCKATGASEYLSGPNARGYLDESRFKEAGIRVVWMDYLGYPEYPQLWGPFAPAVSIVDPLLNTGMCGGLPETPHRSNSQAGGDYGAEGPTEC
jgi:WbqC-like protein family